jgi:hypothetical protein
MHRREFLGASLAGAMAAIFLRLDELMAWWKQWLGTPERLSGLKVDRLTVARYSDALKKMYAHKPMVAYVHPDTHNSLVALLRAPCPAAEAS